MMASGEIRLSGTTMRRMPVLAQSQIDTGPSADGTPAIVVTCCTPMAQSVWNSVTGAFAATWSDVSSNASMVWGAIGRFVYNFYANSDTPLAGIGGVGAVGGAAELSGLGDLTTAEVAQIQSVVNQAGRPLSVVGSAASGSRTALSDIDYVVSPGSMSYFEGLESQLPGLDSHGIIPGAPNPFIGPSITFSPSTFP